VSGLSKIEWCDATWNPVRGCSRVSEGCRNCYAERTAARFSKPGRPFAGFAQQVAPRDTLDRVGGRRAGWTGKVALVPEALDWPLRRRKPLRIFVNSMSDLFHEALPDEVIDRVFAAMYLADWHTFLILTKRSRRMHTYLNATGLPERWAAAVEAMALPHGMKRAGVAGPAAIVEGIRGGWRSFPTHVWLGVSVEDHATARTRLIDLASTPAARRFASVEPLLSAVDLSEIEIYPEVPPYQPGVRFDALRGHVKGPDDMLPPLRWVIVGGESGPGARPCDSGWIRSIVGQCKAASVPVFVKQTGRWILGDDAGFRVNHWLLEDGRGYVPPLIGEPARQRPPTRVCSTPAVGFSLFDRKGGNPAEWPEDLRVRQVPA